MLERWTRAVVRRRVAVLVCWAAVVAVGLFSTARLPGLLSTSLAVPGTGSQEANTILTQRFGENVEGTFTVVFPEANASSTTLRVLDQRFAVAARAVPTGQASPLQRGSGILYGNIGSKLDLQRAAAYTGPLRRALEAAGIPGAYVTGAPAVQHDLSPVLAGDLHVGEVIAVLAALVFLTLALGFSWAVLLPFVVALCTSSGALAIVYALAHEFLMVLYVPNLVQLIGLGLAIDYSLLIVHRFRQELADEDRPVGDAIAATMATAGRTVVLSGVAVAIGLAVLFVIPVPFLRSLGAAGFLVPVVSVLAALSLQPALLSVLGRRGVGAVGPLRPVQRGDGDGLWSRLAHIVIRWPVVMAASATAVLVAAADAGVMAPAHAGLGHRRPAQHPGRPRPGPAAGARRARGDHAHRGGARPRASPAARLRRTSVLPRSGWLTSCSTSLTFSSWPSARTPRTSTPRDGTGARW